VNRSLPLTTKTLVVLTALFILGLLVWSNLKLAGPKKPSGNDRFGLAFISPPDHLADSASNFY
jgi:hypothetical protein